MGNHVHVLLTPLSDVSCITQGSIAGQRMKSIRCMEREGERCGSTSLTITGLPTKKSSFGLANTSKPIRLPRDSFLLLSDRHERQPCGATV